MNGKYQKGKISFSTSEIKQFSKKDLLKMAIYMLCLVLLGQSAILHMLKGEYINMVFSALGCGGWAMIYFHFMKSLKERNYNLNQK